MKLEVTLDTGVLLDLLDEKGSFHFVKQMIKWHQEGYIELLASSRVFDHDTTGQKILKRRGSKFQTGKKMSPERQDRFQQLVRDHGITIVHSPWRSRISHLNGRDVLDGLTIKRSPEEMDHFYNIVASDGDPADLHPSKVGNRLENKIGDFDALRNHFAFKRDVFVTLDRSDYLDTEKRDQYEKELGLTIQSPEEFVRSYSQTFGAVELA